MTLCRKRVLANDPLILPQALKLTSGNPQRQTIIWKKSKGRTHRLPPVTQIQISAIERRRRTRCRVRSGKRGRAANRIEYGHHRQGIVDAKYER
jgi:hypothetical protein